MPIIGITASGITASTLYAYESISTVSVTSATQATVEFTNIPSTYTHLQIRGIARSNLAGTDGNAIVIRFNSDTGSNYSYHALYGYHGASSATVASGSANQTVGYCSVMPCAGHTASIFNATYIDILEYKNTNIYKTVRSIGGYDMNGSATGYNYLGQYSSNWRNTNAITTITLLPDSGSFVQYTTFALYGIRG